MADLRGDSDPRSASYRNRTVGMWLGLLVVLGAFAGTTAWNEVQEPAFAPPFTLVSTGYEGGVLGEPVAFSLSDYAGKTVVLDMMAVSCAPCRIVTEEVLKPLYAEHRDDPGFVLLSIDTWADTGSGNVFGGETDEDIIRLQESTGATWRHARDTDRVYEKYAAVGLPKIVVVDGDGRIVYAKSGTQDAGKIRSVVEASLAGTARPVPFFQAGTTALAAVAGLAAFFAPCCVGLLPAYLGLLVRAEGDPAGAVRRTLLGGARVALALVLVDAVLAVLLLAFGPFLRPRLPEVAVATAVLLILVGALTLGGFPWDRILGRLRPAPGQGFWAFGFAYGAAAFGCTGPVLMPLLLGGFAQGTATGLRVLVVYAGTVAALTFSVAALVAMGRDGILRSLVRHAKWVNRGAALLLVLGGVWLLWLEKKAGVW